MANFRKRNNPSEDDAPMLSDDGEELVDQVAIVSAKQQTGKNNLSSHGGTDVKRERTFEDIVPIVEDAVQKQAEDGSRSEGFMSFEAVDVANDDQAGQGQQRVPLVEDVVNDEYSERLSNDRMLNLSQSRQLFDDKQIKSSRRYLFSKQDEADEEFDQLHQLTN